MEQFNPYTGRFERVREGGPGSGRYPAGSGASPRSSRARTSPGGFKQAGISANAPKFQGTPTFARTPGMQSSMEMYQKVDKDGNKVYREIGKRDEDGRPIREIVLTDEREAYLNELAEYTVHSQGATPQENPVNTIMGGSSGAGKTEFLKSDEGKALVARDAVKIDSDAVKSLIAEYRDTQLDDANWRGAAFFAHDESSIVADRALKLSVAEKYNTIFDGTGDGGEGKYTARLEALSKNGGPIDMVYISIPLKDSLESVAQRAETTRRFIPTDVVTEIHGGVSDRFETALRLSTQRPELKIRTIKLVERNSPKSALKGFKPIIQFNKGKVVSGNIKDVKYKQFQSYATK